jgi:hypothetical protein
MTGLQTVKVGMVGRKIWWALGAALPLLAATMAPSDGVAGMMRTGADGDELAVAAQALPDAALDERRGGFRMGPFEVGLGVDIKSSVNGIVQMVSSLTFMERHGHRVVGRVDVVTPNATSAALPVPTNSAVAAVVQAATGGSGGANITHDYTNGVTATMTNLMDNVTADQRITVNATITNYQALSAAHHRNLLTQNLAAQSAQFRLSR